MGRGTPSVLDAALEETAPTPQSKKLDRIMAALNDVPAMHEPSDNPDDPRPDFDRLLDIVNASWQTFPHTRTAGILRSVCDVHGVPHEKVTEKDVQLWRADQANR